MKKAVVNGADGFIGSHLVRRLRDDGVWVRGVDLKRPEFSETAAHEFVVGDLRDQAVAAASEEMVTINRLAEMAMEIAGNS